MEIVFSPWYKYADGLYHQTVVGPNGYRLKENRDYERAACGTVNLVVTYGEHFEDANPKCVKCEHLYIMRELAE